ncbi:MAG: ABC transporter ATP-binding protein [Aquiluna sp.]|nr:ABC transporter ATP-binding protein [Aquiluna sp.]MCF8545468.1 ABC transporter ATP-binding protein [Aquiluna sp.]
MSTLELKNIALHDGAEDVMYDISATMSSGINLLVGPTLSGKTTLMRLIAGLVKPSSGSIALDGADISNVAVKDRSVAFVYQQFINYPSLTVFENIASPLKVDKVKHSKEEIAARVEEMAKLLGLSPFLKRKPSELSGGQQQRVAIARALARKSDIVLLDEPLANLDYKLREQLRAELQSIFSEENAIVIYSTAEPSEALDFATNSFVMSEGRIIQAGKALDIYKQPVNVAAAKAMADPPINLLPSSYSNQRAIFANKEFQLERPEIIGKEISNFTLGIQPGKITLQPTGSNSIEFSAEVQLAEVTGSSTFVHVKFETGQEIVIEVEGTETFELDQRLKGYFNPDDLYGFDVNTGKSIFFPKGSVN